MAELDFLLIGTQAGDYWSKLLQRLLKEKGHLDKTSEAAAVRRIKKKKYDIIIIDAGEVADPNELTKTVKAASPCTQVVVALSSPTWQTVKQIFQSGAIDFLPKTADQYEIVSRIEEVVQRAHL